MMDMKSSPLSQLQEVALLRTSALIDGHWVGGASRFAVHDPATGQRLADVPNLGAKETEAAIAAANAAWPAWRTKPAKERHGILMKWFALLNQHADDLARIMTAEQGKPLAEARGEVIYGASFIEWFAEEGRRVYGETIPTTDPNKRMLVIKQPIGVCAAITPWNFPIAMITRKVAPALAAGCPVVVKPAEADAAVGAGAGRTGAARRHARRCAQRDHGRCQELDRGRQGAVRVRHRAPPVVHRVDRGRPHPDAAMRAHHQEAVARTRRQRALHRVRRRRPRLPRSTAR